jgi:photosystem II stability/assembly factor-like uncharacterized protein
MTKWLGAIVLTGLIVLLAGCSAVGTGAPSTDVPVATPSDDVQLQFMTTAEAYSLVESGEGILYDTRSVEEYQTLHAAGAASFPEADMAARYAELPTDRALIFY